MVPPVDKVHRARLVQCAGGDGLPQRGGGLAHEVQAATSRQATAGEVPRQVGEGGRGAGAAVRGHRGQFRGGSSA